MPNRTTTRVQLELATESMERLRALKEQTEAGSYTEVIKNALKLYERMIEITADGSHFLVRDKKGATRTLEIFL